MSLNNFLLTPIGFFQRQIIWCMRKAQYWLNAITAGAQAIVINEQHQILLVKHTYRPEWYFPGGGVKQGESTKAAVIRELREEAGIITQTPELFGIYLHQILHVNDYVVLYIVKEFSQVKTKSFEIAAAQWFDYSELPTDISIGTKKRLDEYFLKIPPAEQW